MRVGLGCCHTVYTNTPPTGLVLTWTFVCSPGNRTISDALASENRYQNFANNPRPINFGLEPGDIVFAVFGSIFLAIVGFLTILGFCIHPFFLA